MQKDSGCANVKHASGCCGPGRAVQTSSGGVRLDSHKTLISSRGGDFQCISESSVVDVTVPVV